MTRRLACLVAAGTAVLAVSSPPAVAHVTVHSAEAVQGAFAEIAFRVPTESPTASTVKLKVAFPATQLVESVVVQPHPGWTYQLTTVPNDQSAASSHQHGTPKQVVSEIEWTTVDSGSGGVKPGEYGSFVLTAGPLPSVDELTFKVVQTYSDGAIARWIDVGAQTEFPAPVLSIASSKTRPVAAISSAGEASTLVWWALAASALALVLALGSTAVALYSVRRKE
nr:YcnI family protein [Kibdelosporangium sp. MJ126-NF4]CEL17200.1 Conserved membrane protein in copper uptake, YcnI [Kibdelosporangium sp. MJ126-NF4]CTQ91570.1 Conserved membrane protein in copper uptake, YcnI [Kibdelosporangium sp. MJ126-NF4]